jgi:putative serine protease PepD
MAPEEAGDEDANGPPPHPLDRPWVHPSELFASSRPPAPARAPRRRSVRTRDVVLAAGAGVFGALAMVVVLALAGLLGEPGKTVTVSGTAEEPSGADGAARLVALANPSIVGILATTPEGVRRVSGVFLRSGEVITSAGAVGGATGFTVVAANGSRHAGAMVGQDPTTGLALIRAGGGGSSPAKLAGNDDLQVGQSIVALASTEGAERWVATGVVASLGGWADDGSGQPSPGMITVDAAMPPEARGGALLDRDGQVVGILAGATQDEKGGLATPIATVRDVAAQLASTGKAAHGALGVRAEDGDGPRGARVVSVVDGGAASRAGLAAGDVVVKVDAQTIHDAADLVVAIRRHQPDDHVTVTVLRHKDSRRMDVILGSTDGTTGSTPQPTSASVPATPVSTG